MLEIEDYSKYLSVDNGKGLLLNQDDIIVLENNGFDYTKYSSLSELIFDVDNYINQGYGDDILEEVLLKISEVNYYINTGSLSNSGGK